MPFLRQIRARTMAGALHLKPQMGNADASCTSGRISKRPAAEVGEIFCNAPKVIAGLVSAT